LGYGYRVTNHFTLVALGGPEVVHSTIRGGPGVLSGTTWSGEGSVHYRGERGSASLTYLHYATPGSGVFRGAETDTALLGIERELARTWSGNVSAGWGNNRALSAYSTAAQFMGVGHVNLEFAWLRLNHTLGRSLQAFAVYGLEHQGSGASVVAGSMGRVLTRQNLGAGIEWHPRPFGL
jgi:hypothetical protein